MFERPTQGACHRNSLRALAPLFRGLQALKSGRFDGFPPKEILTRMHDGLAQI